jgi:DNA-binding LacI/PurR family transcriptional regulator
LKRQLLSIESAVSFDGYGNQPSGSMRLGFSGDDEMAAGIIDAAIEQGISVPDELRVVGFNDTRGSPK